MEWTNRGLLLFADKLLLLRVKFQLKYGLFVAFRVFNMAVPADKLKVSASKRRCFVLCCDELITSE